MTDQSEPLFLLGPGYSAMALARLWAGPIKASARTSDKQSALQDQGLTAILMREVDALQAACTGAHLLISAPPGDTGCPILTALGQAVTEAASVTYLSTTGVYGDLNGGWAFEWTPPNPGSLRGHRRLAAELAWTNARPDVRLVRLPGIYGPGRSPLDRVQKSGATRISKPGQVFSRIHVEDLAEGVKALIVGEQSGVFNLCDEEAAPPQDVLAFAANLLGIPAPPEVDFATADLSGMARSFYAECKRVSNARLKAATGWRPRYPTYREGLRAIHKATN
ncbi:MAG: SDR family NAD(P)-dependent oxidoreductase [Henriciella sp.]|nr:SDR family NAD(P)-dependent oxidoreductase [Henriciella sp.]